ncbi:hypothetical protein BY458DRAFT_498688 [Sporodiniella umbellata]|nr:hypothetical protein BY458DRAFT_498688 [Sporodiniella umbellata]
MVDLAIADRLRSFETEITEKYRETPGTCNEKKNLPKPRQSKEIALDDVCPKGFDALKQHKTQKKEKGVDLAKAEDEKKKGNEYFKKQDYRNAELHYTKAIELNPHASVFFVNRSMVYLKIKEYELAKVDAKRGLGIDPNNVKALWRLSTAYKHLGKLESSLSVLKAAIKLDPKNTSLIKDMQEIEQAISDEKHNHSKKVPINVINDTFDLERFKESIQKSSPQPHGSKTIPAKKVSWQSAIAIEPSNSIKKEQLPPVPNQNPEICSKNNAKETTVLDNSLFLTAKEPTKRDVGQKTKANNNPSLNLELADPKAATASKKTIESKNSLLDSSFTRDGTSQQEIALDNKPFLFKKETARKSPMIQVIESISPEKEVFLPPSVPKSTPAPLIKLSVPQSNYEFERDWKTCKSRGGDLLYQYFQNIPPTSFSRLFKSSLESKYFEDILDILSTQYTANNTTEDIFHVLEGLSTVRRLDMLVMFLTKKQAKDLQFLFEKVKLSSVDPDRLQNVAKKYTISI